MSTDSLKLDGPILVLEDDADLREGLVSMLVSYGIESDNIQAYDSVSLASNLVDRIRYSMVVSDWLLPGGGGAALLERIRRSHTNRETPFLVISGFATLSDFALMEGLPLTGVLPKPFSSELLRERLQVLHAEASWYADHRTALSDLTERAIAEDVGFVASFMKLALSAPRPLPFILHMVQILRERELDSQASQVLEIAAQSFPSSTLVAMERVRSALLSGNTEQALPIFDGVRGKIPSSVSRVLLWDAPGNSTSGALAHDGGKVVSERQLSENMDSKLPYPLAQILKAYAAVTTTSGVFLSRQGRVEEGKRLFLAADERAYSRSFRGGLALNQALAYLRLRRYEDTISWAEKASSLSMDVSSDAQRLVSIALARSQQGSSEDSVDLGKIERLDLDFGSLYRQGSVESVEELITLVPELAGVLKQEDGSVYTAAVLQRIVSYAGEDLDGFQKAARRTVEEGHGSLDYLLFLLDFRRTYNSKAG